MENFAPVKRRVDFEVASQLLELHHQNVQSAGGKAGIKTKTPEKGN